jgi:omega-amidase
MKISIIQSDPVWEEKISTLGKLDEMIFPLYGKTDIVILPEMFNTGFSMNTQMLSESAAGGITFKWMKERAVKGGFGLCGSYIVRVRNKYFNRFVFVSPEKEVWYYDKRHLFMMADENIYFSAGNSRLIFKFRDIRISPYICYDLRFPVWSRNRDEYDLAVYTANWPEARISVWNTLIKARAIENQCYVAGANRTGIDGTGIKYSGNSAVINPYGEEMVSAESNECSITAEFLLSDLLDFRKKFPVLNDADDFQIDP